MLDFIVDYLFFGVGIVIVKALGIKKYKKVHWNLLRVDQKQSELILIGVIFWVVVIIIAAIII